jgi:hypothetical protein
VFRIRLRHRARVPLLGKWLRLNVSNGRLTSVTAKLGALSWNSRKQRRARIDLPGGFHSEISFDRPEERS